MIQRGSGDVRLKSIIKKSLLSFSLMGAAIFQQYALAENVNLAAKPLYLAGNVPPMMMLVMGRDHTLYSEAYDDASDINKDGVYDLKYKPNEIDYYGYFESFLCYRYSNNMFLPSSKTSNKKCSSSWSGDYLNYLTMTRLDVMRKVLYGGSRQQDTGTFTVLERTFIPQDGHAWAKSYTSVAVDGFNISEYTPWSLPPWGQRYLIGTSSYASNKAGAYTGPELRQKTVDLSFDPWDWASKERPVLERGDGSLGDYHNRYSLKVRVCDSSFILAGKDNCKQYPNGSYQPTGILHDYGEDGDMEFGLITGSYKKNLSGGVLRRAINKFSDEINETTGQFNPSIDGIVANLEKLNISQFKFDDGTPNSNQYTNNGTCGWITTRSIRDGECKDWGNPIGEMLYESMRYFAGESAPSSSYHVSNDELSLNADTWSDPYATRERCTRAYNLVISDADPTYDSDQLPGSRFFSNYSGSTLSNFNITSLLDGISSQENLSGSYFVGESLDDAGGSVGAPTVKNVSRLSSVRGIAPKNPTRGGSYSVAGVASYGATTDMRSEEGIQNVKTLSVSISPSLPQLKIDVDNNGSTDITLMPFAKSVEQVNIDGRNGQFQPTASIIDYYAENISATSGSFIVSYDDLEQGGDYDMDMLVRYTYNVQPVCSLYDVYCDCNATSCETGVRVSTETMEISKGGGSIKMHAGYIISGTDNDGIFLEVQNRSGLADDGEYRDYWHPWGDYWRGVNAFYYLDTPGDFEYSYPRNSRNKNTGEATRWVIPHYKHREFRVSNNPAGEFLKPPLWYAAKYGWYDDRDDPNTTEDDATANNNSPDAGEWDSINSGEPDGYFLVSHPSDMKVQIATALNLSLNDKPSTSTAPVFNSTVIGAAEDTLQFASQFYDNTWHGDVQAYRVYTQSDGELRRSRKWSAATNLNYNSYSSRRILTMNNETGQVFEFSSPSNLLGSDSSFSQYQLDMLHQNYGGDDVLQYVQNLIDYTKGDRSNEGASSEEFRLRSSLVGAVINSQPYYIGPVNRNYGHEVKTQAIAFGSNEGMVHLVNAETGAEIFSYIPSQVYPHLENFSSQSYEYTPTVDGGITAYTAVDDNKNTFDPTTLVGTLGTHVKGLYAIDVTDLSGDSASSFINKIKWEIKPQGDYSGIGYSKEKPIIAKLNNGRTGVFFSNGYNASANNGEGMIYIADMETGELITTLNTLTNKDHDPSGKNRSNTVAKPTLVDLDANGTVDKVYVGDLFGNMWAFNLESDSTDAWILSTRDSGNRPLFTATSPTLSNGNVASQPITTRPVVIKHPFGQQDTTKPRGRLIAFGTGKYIEAEDIDSTNQATQSFYVIWDKSDDGTSIPLDNVRSPATKEYSDLMHQAITGTSTNSEGEIQRDFDESKKIDWSTYDGLYIDLQTGGQNYGEKQVTNAQHLLGIVRFTTLLPSTDPCEENGGGNGAWYMRLNLNNGTFEYSQFVNKMLFSPRSTTILTTIKNESGDVVKYKARLKDELFTNSGGGGDGGGYEPDSPEGRQAWRQVF